MKILVHSDHIDQALHETAGQADSERDTSELGACNDCFESVCETLHQGGMDAEQVATMGGGILVGIRACQIAIAETN